MDLLVGKVGTQDNAADIGTKPPPAVRFHQLRAMIGIMLVRGAEGRKFYGSLAMEGEPVSLEECNPVTILGWLFIAIMLWKAVQWCTGRASQQLAPKAKATETAVQTRVEVSRVGVQTRVEVAEVGVQTEEFHNLKVKTGEFHSPKSDFQSPKFHRAFAAANINHDIRRAAAAAASDGKEDKGPAAPAAVATPVQRPAAPAAAATPVQLDNDELMFKGGAWRKGSSGVFASREEVEKAGFIWRSRQST